MNAKSHISAAALPPLLKHLNVRTVLEAIRSSAPISRAEISRRAGISKPTVALALGLDVGGRFLRGAICDLRGDVRARLDVEIEHPDASRVLAQIAELRSALVEATGLDDGLLNGVVVGVPGVVDPERRTISLATN